MVQYLHMSQFDKDNVTGSEKISERFYFDNVNRYSYNQAILLIGNKLKESKLHNFEITARADVYSTTETLYEGDNAFYDWFINQDADCFREVVLVRFEDKDTGIAHRLEKHDDDYLVDSY